MFVSETPVEGWGTRLFKFFSGTSYTLVEAFHEKLIFERNECWWIELEEALKFRLQLSQHLEILDMGVGVNWMNVGLRAMGSIMNNKY